MAKLSSWWPDRFKALHNIPPLFRMAWQAAPRIVVWSLSFRVAAALVPVGILATTRLIVDRLHKLSGHAVPAGLWELVIIEFSLAITTANTPGCTPLPPSTTVCSNYGAATGFFSTTGPNIDTQNIYTLSDDIFWTKGKHAFKFGALANRFDGYPYDILGNAGSVGFPSVNGSACPSVNCPLQSFFLGDYSSLGRDVVGANAARQFRWYTFGTYAQDDVRVASHLTLNLGLRYEFTTVPHEINPALAFTLRNPITDPAGTAGNMFLNPSLHNFSPRIGFAWDVFGNGKTALHGGAGIYYDIATYGDIMLNNAIAAPTTTPGQFISSAVTYTNNAANVPLPSPIASAFSTLAASAPPSPRTVDYHLGQPTLLQRNLGIDQQLPFDMGLSVIYVGTRDWHLYQSRDGDPQVFTGVGPNGLPYYCAPANGTPGPPTATNPCAPTANFIQCVNATIVNGVVTAPGRCPGKINPAWNSIQEVRTAGDAYYNSLQVTLNKRTSHGLQFQVGYTWAKELDDGEAQSALENAVNLFQVPIQFSTISDRGPTVFNATHQLRATVIYRITVVKSNGLLSKFVNGWGTAANIGAQTGYPLTPTMSGDRVLYNQAVTTERLDLCPNYDKSTFKSSATNTGNRSTSTFFNINMLCLPVAGTLGNSPKGFFTGPGLVQTDISLTKDTPAKFLGEAGTVEFRAEFFNAINHPNFTAPNVTIFQLSSATPAANPAGGAIGTGTIAAAAGAGTDSILTSTAMRQIQLSLKVIF